MLMNGEVTVVNKAKHWEGDGPAVCESGFRAFF